MFQVLLSNGEKICITTISIFFKCFLTEPGKGSGWESMSQTYKLDDTKLKVGDPIPDRSLFNPVYIKSEYDVLDGRHIDRMPLVGVLLYIFI
ncbi:MAG: hypothetical protein HEEMFOPI_01435 [Holosporales bacterium]